MASNPSGYTTNYGIKKYADASDPGGTALNSNSDIIDAAIKAVDVRVDGISSDPLGYTEFTARITQTGTSAPTVTVQKNTTGATVLSVDYVDVGAYSITMSSNVFTTANSDRKCEVLGYVDGLEIILVGYVAFKANLAEILFNTALTDLTPTDALLSSLVNYILEIKTYP